MRPAAVSRRRRALCAGLLLAPFAPALRAQSDVEVLDFDWTDAAREREVPARLYWPAAAAARGPVPLVVFSHGLGGSRWGYRYLGSHWAEQGFASLHVQHVGSDRSLWGGNPVALMARLLAAAQEGEALNRVADVSHALDRLLDSPQGERIDRRRIVAAGHSYGANTTLLLCGARVVRGGGPADHRDARFAAAVVISAPPFYGEGNPVAILRHVRVPSLHVTATEDVIQLPGFGSGLDDRLATYDAVGSVAKTLALFEGGSHSIFTDRAVTGGAELNPRVKAATRELSVAFFRSVFDDDRAGLGDWAERWRPILARFETRG